MKNSKRAWYIPKYPKPAFPIPKMVLEKGNEALILNVWFSNKPVKDKANAKT
jgi:hypothetical protein